MTVVFALGAAAAAATLSASAGLGGSLILVPALAALLGAKQGVALAALLLAANNVVKLFVYRRTVPLRASLIVLGFTVAGAYVGARLLVAVPDAVVAGAVLLGLALSLAFELRPLPRSQRAAAGSLAFCSGATSGFSGTSGPLKGAAIRSLGLERAHFVGAASLVSLGADVVKAGVFFQAGLLDTRSLEIALLAAPVVVLGALTGRRLNAAIGEPAFMGFFWLVMAGYALRLVA